MNKFTCVDCGELFESLAPPAETRTDDPEPTCSPCLEKQLDGFDTEPLDNATIERIIAEVLRRTACADCGGPIGEDKGPPDGWQLEDGRTVCHACCGKDMREMSRKGWPGLKAMLDKQS